MAHLVTLHLLLKIQITLLKMKYREKVFQVCINCVAKTLLLTVMKSLSKRATVSAVKLFLKPKPCAAILITASITVMAQFSSAVPS